MSDEGSGTTNGKDIYDEYTNQETKYMDYDEDAPNFLVIIQDSDFNSRYNTLRTGAASRAEILEGMLRRKCGSVRVLALSDSKAGVFRNMLEPPPALI